MKRIFVGLFLFCLTFQASTAVASDTPDSITITPKTTTFDNGVSVSIYSFPDGSEMRVPSNLSREILRNSTKAEIQEYGLPAKPSEPSELEVWLEDYANTNVTSGEPLVIDHTTPANTLYSNYWGGYLAGTTNVVNHSYVAVKATFTVPSVSKSCTMYPNYRVGFWVGLGGWNNGADDLVQQGIGWCSPVATNKFVPWTEFAGTQAPYIFCGATGWTLNAGHVIYNNMSYQTSTDTAYFYMQDQTTGETHSCNRSAPKFWSFNGNVAECISETPPQSYLADYGTIRFTNCQVELGSNSTWYPIGARSSVKEVTNLLSPPALAVAAQDTGPLGSDNKSFTMTYIRSY